MTKASADNHANQLNPTHPEYHRGRGSEPAEANRQAKEAESTFIKQAETEQRQNQNKHFRKFNFL